MSRYAVLLVTLMLAACSSKPIPPVNYYVLDQAELAGQASVRSDSPIVLLESIHLAEYLNQSNMAMQLDTHQVYYSRQHLWAEGLHKSIRRALLSDLNQVSQTSQFASADTPLASKARLRLRLDLDHFVATDGANVLVAGTYWLTDPQGEYLMHQPFKYSTALSEDGFGHSVQQLRSVLKSLATDIARHAAEHTN